MHEFFQRDAPQLLTQLKRKTNTGVLARTSRGAQSLPIQLLPVIHQYVNPIYQKSLPSGNNNPTNSSSFNQRKPTMMNSLANSLLKKDKLVKPITPLFSAAPNNKKLSQFPYINTSAASFPSSFPSTPAPVINLAASTTKMAQDQILNNFLQQQFMKNIMQMKKMETPLSPTAPLSTAPVFKDVQPSSPLNITSISTSPSLTPSPVPTSPSSPNSLSTSTLNLSPTPPTPLRNSSSFMSSFHKVNNSELIASILSQEESTDIDDGTSEESSVFTPIKSNKRSSSISSVSSVTSKKKKMSLDSNEENLSTDLDDEDEDEEIVQFTGNSKTVPALPSLSNPVSTISPQATSVSKTFSFINNNTSINNFDEFFKSFHQIFNKNNEMSEDDNMKKFLLKIYKSLEDNLYNPSYFLDIIKIFTHDSYSTYYSQFNNLNKYQNFFQKSISISPSNVTSISSLLESASISFSNSAFKNLSFINHFHSNSYKLYNEVLDYSLALENSSNYLTLNLLILKLATLNGDLAVNSSISAVTLSLNNLIEKFIQNFHLYSLNLLLSIKYLFKSSSDASSSASNTSSSSCSNEKRLNHFIENLTNYLQDYLTCSI